MQRTRTAILSAAALAAGLLGAPAARATVPSASVITIQVSATDANGTDVVLPCAAGTPVCVWDALVTGTYNYDTFRAGDQIADAECSTDDHSTEGGGIVDPIGYGTGLEPSPISEWQRFRYVVPFNPSGITGITPGIPILGDTLDLQWAPAPLAHSLHDNPVVTLPVEWVPPSPTVVDYGKPSAPGVVAGCDSATHIYDTLVVSDGADATNFTISDTYYADNAGFLTVTLHQVV